MKARTGRRTALAALSMIIAVGGATGAASAQWFLEEEARGIIEQAQQFADQFEGADRGERIVVTPKLRAHLKKIDAQANQKDAAWSRLFWHTDLDSALADAKRLNRPVLSLRMLGRLDEEYSCANSRFFRAALYANAEVSAYLRDHFVLHWESVRPVPRITIDYGDGRVIESTITGNSIHYVLSPDGVVVDALPGLYGPGVFLEALKSAHAAANGKEYAMARPPVEMFNNGRFEEVPAALAMRVALSKARIEMPVLNAVLGLEAHPVEAVIPFEASGYIERCRLDARSTSLIRTQMGDAEDGEASRTIAEFERMMALDTAQNEEVIRPAILAMIESDPSLRHDLVSLNERVYSEVFRTPSSDPWLGLRAEDAFTGLWAKGRARPGG